MKCSVWGRRKELWRWTQAERKRGGVEHGLYCGAGRGRRLSNEIHRQVGDEGLSTA